MGEAVKHSAEIVRAVTVAWAEIIARHDEVPTVLLTFGSGTANPKRKKMGHYSANRWIDNDGAIDELFLAGEYFALGAIETMSTLLHEGVHGINKTRCTQDVTRQGRYHNKHFARVAKSVGLEVHRDPTHGVVTTIPERTVRRYSTAIDALEEGLALWRREDAENKTSRSSRIMVPMACGCGRRLPVVLLEAKRSPIRCKNCSHFFVPLPDWLAEQGLTSWEWDEFGPEETIVRPQEVYLPFRPAAPAFEDPEGPWLYLGHENGQESLFNLAPIPVRECRVCRAPKDKCACTKRWV